MIKAVIFDCDGVLLRPWGREDFLRENIPDAVEPLGEFFEGPFEACLVGNGDMRILLPPFLEKAKWPGDVDHFFDTWLREEKNIDKDLMSYIAVLRQNAFRVFVGTNQEKYRAHYLMEGLKFRDAFDGIFSSHEIGARKPDSAYYKQVTKQLGLDPSEILFWDDLEENISSAKYFGWNAEVFSNFESFKKLYEEKYAT